MERIRCPRMCGRAGELAELARLVRTGGVAVLSGPAGIGKSRLVAEASGLAEQDGMIVVMGRATPESRTQPYAPIRKALFQVVRHFGVPDDDGLAGWRGALGAVLPTHLLGTQPVEAEPSLVGEAVLQLLGRVPPLVMVLEDLHWADPDTIAMVDYLADAAAGHRTAWLLTTRDAPEFVDRLRERRTVTPLALTPLGSAAVGEMVRACRPAGNTAEVLARAERFAEGVPLFVEELIGSPGVPETFAEAVDARWTALPDRYREVLAAAAVLGRDISSELLGPVVAVSGADVDSALRAGIDAGLLERRGPDTRFRHALTREALVAALPAADRSRLATAALAVVTDIRPDNWQGLAAELALLAGDRRRAAGLLAQAGRAAVEGGALATAVDSLQRAVELSHGEDRQARVALVAALSAAGAVDHALAEGAALLVGGEGPSGPIRLLLAEAAARGGRWGVAVQHLAAVGDAPELADRASMLGAEIAFATGETQAARAKVVRLLEQPETEAAIATRAHILLGRIDRLSDLSAARDSFEAALATATAAHAPVQVLDALHELGTIELLGFAGTTRLLQARATAAHIGAMGTVAVIDLQLTAAYLSRFDTGAAERHAAAAYEVADRLGLHAVAAKALCGLAETQVQRCQPAEMERLLGLALGRDPSEPFTEAFGWGQCRGMLALFEDDWPRALDCFGRGVALLAGVVNPEPVEFRALWPLLLAGLGDERAAGALESARRAADLHIAFCNRGLLGYASAVLAGRTGDRVGAEELAVRADAYLARFPFWGDLARLCAAPGAERDGWGQPQLWLATAEPTFARLGLAALARRCRALPQAGLTHREAEVLALVSEGLSNKQIGAQLHLSPRTVEKHVESLLRKTSRASRTQLALWRAGRNT